MTANDRETDYSQKIIINLRLMKINDFVFTALNRPLGAAIIMWTLMSDNEHNNIHMH